MPDASTSRTRSLKQMGLDVGPSAPPTAATDWQEYWPAPARTGRVERIAARKTGWPKSFQKPPRLGGAALFRAPPPPTADRYRWPAPARAWLPRRRRPARRCRFRDQAPA